jgi:hypothetical protein
VAGCCSWPLIDRSCARILFTQAESKARNRQLEAQLRELRVELGEGRSGREAAKASQVADLGTRTPRASIADLHVRPWGQYLATCRLPSCVEVEMHVALGSQRCNVLKCIRPQSPCRPCCWSASMS